MSLEDLILKGPPLAPMPACERALIAWLQPNLAQLELAGLGARVEDRLQPFARDRLCQGIPEQLILGAQAGRNIADRGVDRALGAGDRPPAGTTRCGRPACRRTGSQVV